MKTVRFIMAVHNHQPVGNFDHVFQEACEKAYHPFLDLLDKFPDFHMALHYSGPLLEWAFKHDKALIQRIAEGVRSKRFELLGGGYGEPILSMLTDADLNGQVELFRRFVKERFDFTVRGAWVAERVWEPHLAGALAGAEIEYAVVDDYHFRCAGLRDEELFAYYIAEDRGRLVRMFGGSQFLRYGIPFRDTEEIIAYLRDCATEDGNSIVVYADDGEKFGMWPETYKHVYENEWLLRFLSALHDNRDWIRVQTFAEAMTEVEPRGRIYIGDASYPEMTEWVLPMRVQEQLAEVRQAIANLSIAEKAAPFLRGGLWRSFRAKYVEAAQMYARMMEVSNVVADRGTARKIAEARRELYRAQCNCAYWHGVFGGLYMPFLRFAVYHHLLRAENLLARARERPGRTVSDFDLDGRAEAKLHSQELSCYLKPDRGGALYELDDRVLEYNLTAVMTRRSEAYHSRLVEGVHTARENGNDDHDVASIHEVVRCKEPGLENLLFEDPYVRDSLVDHFYPVATTPTEMMENRASESGDFVSAKYDLDLPRSHASEVTLRRRGLAGPPNGKVPVILSKRVSLGRRSRLDIRYALSFPQGAPKQTMFAVEFNLGLMAGDAPDRNYFSVERENLGNLSTLLQRDSQAGLGLVDEWLGVEIWITAEPSACFFTYPVESVNDSEGGFERVYQGSAIVVSRTLDAAPGEENILDLSLEVRHR